MAWQPCQPGTAHRLAEGPGLPPHPGLNNTTKPSFDRKALFAFTSSRTARPWGVLQTVW
jgi:hypothetical protein